MVRFVLALLLLTALAISFGGSASAGSMNGSAGQMPAFYDDTTFTINFKQLPPQAEDSLDEHNKSVNFIYQSDPGLPGGKPFISVIDAIQGDGFNALWEEIQITFNAGFTPHQFTRDDDILAAAMAGEITLTDTDEIYRCSVVGKKK